MKINQIYEIVNSIAEQSLGLKDLTATDTSFVDVGKTVLSSDDNKDAFFGTLFNRIGKTVFDMRVYTARGNKLKKESFEWGLILQKLNMPLPKAVQNSTWDNVETEAVDQFTKSVNKPRQKFYTYLSTWEVPITVPDVQLKTAFTNGEAMGAFIDLIFTAMYNSLEVAYENIANLCRCNFIAKKSTADNEATYINLLADYNDMSGNMLSIDECKTDKDFLAYCAMRINLISEQMTTMSAVFNEEGYERHTPKDLQIINVLSEFASTLTTYLEANTYHKELVALPNYETIPYWQGSGKTFDFESCSKIVVKPENAEEEVVVENVVALIHDIEAIGTTIQNKRTTSARNNRGEYTNFFAKADLNYYNDLSENGVVFYLA